MPQPISEKKGMSGFASFAKQKKDHGKLGLLETLKTYKQLGYIPVANPQDCSTVCKIGCIENAKPKDAARISAELSPIVPCNVQCWFLLLALWNGSTIQPGTEDAQGNFHQNIFVLDFDNEGATITPENALERCRREELDVVCLYFTFGSTPKHPRFHICFLEQPGVTSHKNSQAIIDAYHRVFPEADPTHATPDAIYYGSNGIVWNPDGSEWYGWKEVMPWRQC